MTTESLRRPRIFVNGIARSAEAVVDLALAVASLRRDETARVLVSGGDDSAPRLLFEAGRIASDGALAELRGFAIADEKATGADPEDLQPARALRRALADGRISAADIGYACAFEFGSDSDAGALAALERGLGRFSAATTLEVGSDPLVRCIMAISSDASIRGAVALVINPGVGSIALAFGRP
ncbi:MAG: hypothetical protein ABI797_05515 [Chloroflexota bacterium]